MLWLLGLAPVLFIILFGIFDGAQTVRKDAPHESIFWKHDGGIEHLASVAYDQNTRYHVNAYDRWFIGGNKWYPPHKIFHIKWPGKEHQQADFWHSMKGWWTFCISGATVTAALAGSIIGWWIFIPYIFLYGVEGLVFNFFYKYAFRKKQFRSKNILEYIKSNVLSHPKYK